MARTRLLNAVPAGLHGLNMDFGSQSDQIRENLRIHRGFQKVYGNEKVNTKIAY